MSTEWGHHKDSDSQNRNSQGEHEPSKATTSRRGSERHKDVATVIGILSTNSLARKQETTDHSLASHAESGRKYDAGKKRCSCDVCVTANTQAMQHKDSQVVDETDISYRRQQQYLDGLSRLIF